MWTSVVGPTRSTLGPRRVVGIIKPANAFRVRGVPTTYIIENNGQIVRAGHPASMNLEGEVGVLLANGKLRSNPLRSLAYSVQSFGRNHESHRLRFSVRRRTDGGGDVTAYLCERTAVAGGKGIITVIRHRLGRHRAACLRSPV
jgi:hypothetical protein